MLTNSMQPKYLTKDKHEKINTRINSRNNPRKRAVL